MNLKRPENQSAATGLGDAGDLRLQRAIRAHGNLAAYAPMALLLLLLMELNGAGAALLHAGGGLLLLSRAVHAYGVSQMRERTGWRTAGLVGTFTRIPAFWVPMLLSTHTLDFVVLLRHWPQPAEAVARHTAHH